MVIKVEGGIVKGEAEEVFFFERVPRMNGLVVFLDPGKVLFEKRKGIGVFTASDAVIEK